MNETLLSQIGIIAVITGSPGPNNLLLMTTGLHFGLRRSLPLVLGILLGCALMIISTSVGISQLFAAAPISKTLIGLFSATFLAYLIVRLLQASGTGQAPGTLQTPWGLWQGALFQWLNPKAWLMCITLVKTTATPQLGSALQLAFLFCLVAAPLLLIWSAGGQYLTHWLSNPRRLRWFNRIMALCLLGSAVNLIEL